VGKPNLLQCLRGCFGAAESQGVTAGYTVNGILRWEAFSRMETVWAVGLPGGDLCAAGGYDALITCWRPRKLG
jgi:hypothetical protein